MIDLGYNMSIHLYHNKYSMFNKYISHLLEKAEYQKDESWYIVASIPWYQWFYSQGENMEQARENLIDAIEWVLFIKIQKNDPKIISEIKRFIWNQQLEYA